MSHTSIFGHTYFGHKSAIFGAIGLKILLGTQETIIYRLVMRNLNYDLFFVLDFWATNGGKIGVAITRAPNGLGRPNSTKKIGPLGELFGLAHISKTCFRNFQA